jgi:hypothetical protein
VDGISSTVGRGKIFGVPGSNGAGTSVSVPQSPWWSHGSFQRGPLPYAVDVAVARLLGALG